MSVKLKQKLKETANHQCEYVDQKTGRRCTSTHATSTHALEVDHVKPLEFGGGNEPENLRILCRNHNRFRAWEIK